MNTKNQMRTKITRVTQKSLVGAIALIGAVGCSQTASVTGTSSNATTAIAANSCSTTVVDRGLKGTVATTARGIYSDVRVNPVNGYPATVYVDSGAAGGNQAITFSYFDGTKYQHEVIAGDALTATAGSAARVRLAFLSTGQPLVYWTYATTNTTHFVRMAARSAALTSSASATWTTYLLDSVASATVASGGPIEVAVNPNDQVALVYGHSNGATQRPRSLLCSSNCAVGGNYLTMTAATDFIATASVAVATEVGVAWCKNNASTWFPATAYHGVGNFLSYSVCRNSDLTQCSTAAGWSTLTTATVATAGSNIAKLHIDPTIVGDNPKILARTAAGGGVLTAYMVAQGCNNPPTSLSAAAGVAVATVAGHGDAWAQLLKDANGFFHVVANISTTGIGYINSTNAAGFAATTWNVFGSIDTQTLSASGATGGGADLSTTNDTLYASYGSAPGTSPANVVLGQVSGLQNVSSAGVFSTVYPNTTGHIMAPVSTTFSARNNSMAATSAGRPAVAYVDYSTGGALGVGGRLKYAYRNGTSSSDSWIINQVPASLAAAPHFPSLAFDGNNLPWISFYDDTTFGTQKRYYLLTNSRTDGTGTWTQYVFPFYTKTTVATLPALDETALGMWVSGGVYYPIMVIANSQTTGLGLRAAKLNPITGKWGTVQLIDGIASGLARLHSDFDTNGNLVIGWYDLAAFRPKYAAMTSGANNTTWSAATNVGTATGASNITGVGGGISVKLDTSGVPAASYYDISGGATAGKVVYNKCTLASASACASAAGWLSPVTVNSATTHVGVGTISSNSQMLLGTAMTMSGSTASVYFPTGSTATTAVGFLKGVGSSSFDVSTVLAAANGDTTSSPNATAQNFALAGWSPSGAQSTSRGTSAISYIGPGNWLYVTSCGD
jgi:hypothetical protein